MNFAYFAARFVVRGEGKSRARGNYNASLHREIIYFALYGLLPIIIGIIARGFIFIAGINKRYNICLAIYIWKKRSLASDETCTY